ncbi:pH response protein PalF [Talaromyces proteolyticus]|uniref:PH response protein PalF n=1 Tax=Talaromyces proteolyticus TaxID=1131652 RepID=A0AAD4KUK4_9EURO|nr:pH response protein PalF [Talaromyces proteolyticus]KAH8700284.1 pH response protein PalF [Talaromyces proteolyticus]
MSVQPLSGPSTAPSPSQRNKWVDKLTSRFGNRNRNISEFYVQPDDPWRSYFPGDIINGTVVLTVVKPIRITHLVVCLHGYVKVFKNTILPGEASPEIGFLGPGRGRRAGEYMGNGFATLFEDELVLCGDGRLKQGIYKFKFELGLPPYNLPSSINFERGTISYIISSTLTRPTTIGPTLSCHRRITVLENLDIAPFPPPKPRIVSLEPVTKKSKSRFKQRAPSGEQIHDSTPNGLNVHDPMPPLSPAPSEVSGSSRLSTSSQSFQVVGDSNRTASVRSTSASFAEKNITATAELSRSGALPGDTIPIKISINHTRQVRSPHGIIITLFRQGRIDMHPAIPLGPSDADGKRIYEDFIPKSRTGLSGLSLGTGRSSSVFRKDLSQTFAPLIVDPMTMTAAIKTSIRLPEDAFPTITRVPGAMISFRYYVEVVIDLRGKLATSDRFLPRLNMVSGGSNFSSSGQVLSFPDQTSSSITSNWSGNILDTDQIRREKGVVAVMFEVVVGTRDSNRRQPQHVDESALSSDGTNNHYSGDHDTSDAYYNTQMEEQGPEYYPYDDYHDPEDASYWQEHPVADDHHYQSLGGTLLPPESHEPEDEKTRLRRAEEMLLPSQPPGEGVAGPSTVVSAPTAPDIPEDESSYDLIQTQISNDVPATMSVDTIVPGPSQANHLSDQTSSRPDDKQELERQRLMTEASAPSSQPEGNAHDDGGTHATPTAPILDEEDQISNLDAGGGEALPRYQR